MRNGIELCATGRDDLVAHIVRTRICGKWALAFLRLVVAGTGTDKN
jgi:hypothetical protein